MDDEEDDRPQNEYVGPRSLSFFEDLKAEIEAILDEELILGRIDDLRGSTYQIRRVHYRQDIDDQLHYGYITILYSFETDAQPRLSVYHQKQFDYSPILSFPLNNEYVQQNLRPCFRAWVAQAFTLPHGWRDVRFNAYLQQQMLRHATTRRVLQTGRLPEEIIQYILHRYINE